jgi:hypothetical protein
VRVIAAISQFLFINRCSLTTRVWCAMIKNRLESKLLLCAAAFGALSAVGCANESADRAVADSESDNAALVQTTGTVTLQAPANPAPVSIPSPEGSYFADVIANGTGCPAGSWVTSISPDGQVFTTTFSSYEVQINDQVPDLTITRNCQISITLHSPGGLSYGVQSFFYSGYAFLEQGVTATQSARYYFQGNPVPSSNTNRVVLTGPYDQDFVFKDEVKTADTVWSPCGADRLLNIVTSLQVRNSSPKRSGYANLAALDGSTKLELRLAWKACGDAGVPKPILPDAGVVRKP